MEDFTKTQDLTGSFDGGDIESNKTMAILAYLSILVLVPLFTARNSKFAMFHVNQGIVLAIVEVVIGAVMGVLVWIPFVGMIVSIVGGLVGLVCLVLAIWGIINAANGQAKKLPVIGNIVLFKY